MTTNVASFPSLLVESPVIIRTGNTQSGMAPDEPFNLAGTSLVGLKMPAVFDGTQLTLQVAMQQNDTFLSYFIFSAGATTDVIIPVAINRFIDLDPAGFASVAWIKLTSDAVQLQDSTIYLISRPV